MELPFVGDDINSFISEIGPWPNEIVLSSNAG